MKIEELLEERYILENKWPGCEWAVGTVFPANFFNFKDFPYLFRKMDWYEGRSIEDMPAYVKRTRSDKTTQVLRVLHPSCDRREFGHEPNTIEHRFVYPNAYGYLPATEEEFDLHVASK